MITLAFVLGLMTIYDISVPETEETTFEFYLGDFLDHQLDLDHPMARLIANRLASSLFETNSQDVFLKRLHQLKQAVATRPELQARFLNLNEKLKQAFELKIKTAKRKRLIYSAGGSLVGAVVGLPVGKILASRGASMGHSSGSFGGNGCRISSWSAFRNA